MVGITYLNNRLYKFAQLVADAGGKGGGAIEVHYKGKVYLLSLVPTGEKYQTKSHLNHVPKKPGIKLQTSDCPYCGGFRVGAHCINSKCEGKPST